MRKKLGSPIPKWAISQQDIVDVNLPIGFLRDFIDYVELCTDAPRVFALGTGLGILAVACGKCNVVVKSSDPKLESILPIRLWQALLGTSGQRKSKVMDLGVGLLQRTNHTFLLPDDGSVEAWHDEMVEQPISLMYQEELSGLFDAQQRSYSNGLQSWMLKLWSGTDKDRKTKGGGIKSIVRPRLNVLGAIPPDVFLKKTKSTDWRSGYLPRFLYWGGAREEWADNCYNAPKQELFLSEQLKQVHFNSDGNIIIPHLISKMLSEWFYDTIESKREDFLEDTYAGLLRLQEVGHIIAALVALSRSMRIVSKVSSTRLLVLESDMSVAIKILNLCKKTIESISSRANKDGVSVIEESIVDLLIGNSAGLTAREVVSKLPMSYDAASKHLKSLATAGIVSVTFRPGPSRGRPSNVYKYSE
jgi:DNA-binding transcriptional ArsR family regulator